MVKKSLAQLLVEHNKFTPIEVEQYQADALVCASVVGRLFALKSPYS